LAEWEWWTCRDGIGEQKDNVLDEAALSTGECGVGESESGLEAIGDKVLLAMRPLKLKVVHRGTATGQMRGIIRRIPVGAALEVGGRDCGTKGLRRLERVEWGGHLLGHVEDRLDAPLEQALPIAGVVLWTYPDAGNDLDRAISIWDRGRATVLLLAVDEGTSNVGGGEGDDRGSAGALWAYKARSRGEWGLWSGGGYVEWGDGWLGRGEGKRKLFHIFASGSCWMLCKGGKVRICRRKGGGVVAESQGYLLGRGGGLYAQRGSETWTLSALMHGWLLRGLLAGLLRHRHRRRRREHAHGQREQ
jgi:hypothetical protein